MKSRSLALLLCLFLLSGCLIVPKSRLNKATAKSAVLEKEIQSQEQELAKSSKRNQELEATNRSLAAELVKAQKKVAEKEKELQESQALTDSLLKQMKSIR